VSNVDDMGMTPRLDVNPTVGLIPTIPFRSAGNITYRECPVRMRHSYSPDSEFTHTSIRLSPDAERAHVASYCGRTAATGSPGVLRKVIRVASLPSARRVPF